MLPLRPPHPRAYCFGDLSRNGRKLGLRLTISYLLLPLILTYYNLGVGVGFRTKGSGIFPPNGK